MKGVYNQFGQYIPRKVRIAKKQKRQRITKALTRFIIATTIITLWLLMNYLCRNLPVIYI